MRVVFLIPPVMSILGALGSITSSKKLEITAIIPNWSVGVMAARGGESPEGREVGSGETDMAMGYVLQGCSSPPRYVYIYYLYYIHYARLSSYCVYVTLLERNDIRHILQHNFLILTRAGTRLRKKVSPHPRRFNVHGQSSLSAPALILTRVQSLS